jgi:hypothetical protein
MPYFLIQNYAKTAGVPGVATNASFVGEWIQIDDSTSVGVQVVMTGTSSPVATWGADISNDAEPTVSVLGATALTLTADMVAQNPIGDAANINFLFQFDPAPRAKWFRFKYTRASGGSATATLLKIGIATQGAAP